MLTRMFITSATVFAGRLTTLWKELTLKELTLIIYWLVKGMTENLLWKRRKKIE